MRYTSVLTIAAIVACSVADAQNPKWDKCRDKDIPGEQIYKHYTGALGDERIALDLIFGFCGGSNYGGSTYYFPGEAGRTRIIIGEPDSFDLHITLHAHEQAEENPFSTAQNENSRDEMPRWTFRVLDEEIQGERTSADKKEKKKVWLKEDYRTSVPMDLVWSKNKTGDQLLYTQPSPKAKVSDAAFVISSELTFLGEPTKHSQTLATYLGTEGNPRLHDGWLLPVYNDDGFLVFDREIYKMGSRIVHHKYLNLDVQRQQVLALTDVLQPGKMLQSLIATALREKYGLDDGKKLSTWFRFENPPMDEFMLTDGGIAFCYDTDDLKEWNGNFTFEPVSVVIPYCTVRDILQPGFRRRMGL